MRLSERVRRGKRALKTRKVPRLAAPCLKALGLPEDVARGEARLTVCGRECALVENIAGVAELTGELVRLRSRSGEVAVTGAELRVRDARADALYVTGLIRKIEFTGGEAL